MWSDQFWFPKNISWNDFVELKQKGVNLPEFYHLIYVFPSAIVFYISRLLFERYIAQPIGRAIGIRDYPIRKSRFTPLRKFSESFWYFIYFFSMVLYGFIILINKPWAIDTQYCWLNYPNHPLSNAIFYYYMIELSFYWSLIFTQFIDVKRKDFWEMFLHHIVTILLLSISYVSNNTRIGSLVLIIHDFGDIWLLSAKMAKYAGAQKICDILFGIFAVVWCLTRLCYYPYKILYATIYEQIIILGSRPLNYFFGGSLVVLQILHIFWFYIICQMAISAYKTGQVKKDERSDSEDSDREQKTDNNDVRKDN